MSILFERVGKNYKNSGKSVVAVKDFDLSVLQDEFVCIIGPSGCGKSTILNLTAGFLVCDQGQILHQGKQVEGPGPERAVVFQEDAVFPWMTVRDNIGYSARMKGIEKSKREEIVDRYINLVGLEKFTRFYPKELSGGMKKRVDLARAYASEPATLLLDEPFGSLDFFTRQTMQRELLHLWELERKTVLFVTHDIEEAIFLADRIVVMTATPGRIMDIVKIPCPRPREEEIMNDAIFLSLKRELVNMVSRN